MSSATKTLVDVAVGGSLMRKNIEDAYQLIEKIVANAYQWPSKITTLKKTLGVRELDAHNSIYLS